MDYKKYIRFQRIFNKFFHWNQMLDLLKTFNPPGVTDSQVWLEGGGV